MNRAMSELRKARALRALGLATALLALGPAASAQALTSTPLLTASRHSTSLSTAAIVIAALAALAALLCAAWGIARWRALEPRWTLSLRHAIAEAGFRASATWAEFADWMKLGH